MLKHLLIMLFTALSVGFTITHAQTPTVLTVNMPFYMKDTYNTAYFEPFRQAHPGVDVVVVTQDQATSYPPSPVWEPLDEHLNSVGAYVSSADVLFVQSDTFLTQESTRANYWRDMLPLVAADPDLAESNFYPAAWRAYQWDGGMWALPTTIHLGVLTYNPAAFDQAGLTYPDERWTIDQFIAAALALTERDNNGAPTKLGCFCDDEFLYYSLLGGGLVDMNGLPQLDNPELAALMDKWLPVNAQIYPVSSDATSSQGVPMQMAGVHSLILDADEPMAAASMPGGFSAAYMEGFGISAGSLRPELAFELVKFLAQNPRNVSGIPGQFPSLRSAYAGDNPMNNFSSENQAIISAALENAIGGSDFQFFNYVYWVANYMRQDGVDVRSALQAAQARALANLEAASQWSDTQNLIVATPAPTAVFGADEIILHFGISQNRVANAADWERIAQEFAAADPQIGQIIIEYQGMDYQGFMENNDCYYLNYDGTDPYRISDYVNLDPYVNADPNFNVSNFLPGALDALQLNGMTWGYPLSMQPIVLSYNRSTFEETGIPVPGATWTVNEFHDAIITLQNADLGLAAFSSRYGVGAADLLLLIAAYGGLPIDYRTEPPVIRFNDPATITAIGQVLDVAKTGAIAYSRLGTFSYNEMPGPSAITVNQVDGNFAVLEAFEAVNFPQGSEYQTIALGEVGGMYISKQAQNPDACYRWMATVAKHPELLPDVMPATLSSLNADTLIAAQGQNAVSMYQEFTRLLSEPNTIIFQSNVGGGGVASLELFYISQWLGRAFDAYVLNDEDLDSALNDAQSKVDDFLVCVNNLPAMTDNTVEALNAHYEGISGCVGLVDPEMLAEQQTSAPSN